MQTQPLEKSVKIGVVHRAVLALTLFLPCTAAAVILRINDFSWGNLAVIAVNALVLPGLALVAITLYAHRNQTHKAIELAKSVQLVCRILVFLFGMRVREWVAVHLTHHKYSDTELDPHSPVIEGFWKVAYGTAVLFHRAKKRPDIKALIQTLDTDWLDRRVFDYAWIGPVFLVPAIQAAVFIAAYGTVSKVWIVLFTWPFAVLFFLWAGGAVNALGHTAQERGEPDTSGDYLGDFSSSEGVIFGIPTMGELSGHDLHHRDPTSAKFHKNAWRDLGWCLIVLLKGSRLATVNHVHTW